MRKPYLVIFALLLLVAVAAWQQYKFNALLKSGQMRIEKQ